MTICTLLEVTSAQFEEAGKKIRTVECECDKLQGHVPQPDI
jgi:hypothetical protein